jgi:hypothetical protein
MMSVQPAPENLFDAIGKLLKPERREYFYQRMLYFRHLRPEDEMLRIAEAMGFLALVIGEAPQEMAREREQLAEILTRFMESLQTAYQASVQYHQQLEERLSKLPAEIAEGINAEAIASKLSERLRQQFLETGLPAMVHGIGVHATTLRHTSKELSAVLDEFGHSTNGAVPRVNKALSSMKADLKNAADHVRVQMDGLGKELWRTVAILCLGTLVIGIFIGMLYQRWIDSPLQPLQPSAPTVQLAPPASPSTPSRIIRRAHSQRLQVRCSKWVLGSTERKTGLTEFG